ncbi:CU044_2847 family protein [Sphaerisporangium aureirubrum]|uniref:CU044_2847 family protein n=1 Tax=Sphaerisporangium aureirubrum TaxID=1544736 RepID=A0ABW1NHV7_9ACTN
MIVQTIPVRVGDVTLDLEVSQKAGSEPLSRLGDAAHAAHDAFVRAQDAILEVAASTAATMTAARSRGAAPTVMEVEFGLKFSTTGSVVIAGVSGEATITVKMTYDSAKSPSPGAAAPTTA